MFTTSCRPVALLKASKSCGGADLLVGAQPVCCQLKGLLDACGTTFQHHLHGNVSCAVDTCFEVYFWLLSDGQSAVEQRGPRPLHVVCQLKGLLDACRATFQHRLHCEPFCTIISCLLQRLLLTCDYMLLATVTAFLNLSQRVLVIIRRA